MKKDQVVIEENGWRFVFDMKNGSECVGCKINSSRNKACNMCASTHGMSNKQPICTSATKIQPEPKMYFAWNREDARHLVGKLVEFNTGTIESVWSKSILLNIENREFPFSLQHANYAPLIREIPTTQMTRSELNEKYPELVNVVIVEDGED